MPELTVLHDNFVLREEGKWNKLGLPHRSDATPAFQVMSLLSLREKSSYGLLHWIKGCIHSEARM